MESVGYQPTVGISRIIGEEGLIILQKVDVRLGIGANLTGQPKA